MARRPSRFNWSFVLLGIAVLAAGAAGAIVFAMTHADMPGGRRDQIAGTIVGIAFIPAVILIAKGCGMK